MRKIYTTHFGSRLFGTSTPSSDTDIKHLVLPSIEDLLIGRRIANKVKKTNEEVNVRNTSEDVDEEFIPLQQFAVDFFEGQAYALEIAFSMEGTHAGQTSYDDGGSPSSFSKDSLLGEFVNELSSKFLTKTISAMMGYSVNQAYIYSMKGERLNAAKAVLGLLGEFAEAQGQLAEALDANPRLLERAKAVAAEFPKYFSIGEYEVGRGRNGPCFRLLDKVIPWSVTPESAMATVRNAVKKYGGRAQSASSDNVDWKATMHAVRIMDEGAQLLRSNSIALPHPPEAVKRYLAIKAGELPIDGIREELAAKVETLKELSDKSQLPERTEELVVEFQSWLANWMMRFYGIERPTPVRRNGVSP